MTFTAFLLILVSAILHASWNLLSKARRPSLVFYMQSSFTASLLWLTFIVWGIHKVNWAAVPGWMYVMFICSVIAEVVYFIGLANAYKRTDISMAYPMARALPVLFTAVLTYVFALGKPLSLLSMIGMFLIFIGCFVMPMTSFKDIKLKNYFNVCFIFIVLAACGTTGYTIFDSQALKALSGTFDPADKVIVSCMYLGMMEFSIATTLLCMVPWIKTERQEMKMHFCRSLAPSLAGLFSSSAYCIILLAMPLVTNVSLVQAFRQISLPVCFAAGVFLLGEKITPPKTAGLILIVSGLVLSVF